MEGGGMAGNFLDPAAQEFHPVLSPAQFSLLPPPPIYYPYGAPPAAPAALPVPLYQSAHSLNPSPYVSPAAALPDTKPTRALLLSSVPPHTTEGAVRVEMEAFGGVRAVEMGRLHGEGLVTVHFYDLRSAQAALAEIREQHVRQQSLLGQQYGFVGGMVPGSRSGSGSGLMSTGGNWAGGGITPPPLWVELLGGNCSSSVGGYCGGGQAVVVGRGLVAGRAVWAQFAPETAGLDGPNNGSLVVFNLDSDVASAALKEVFQVFGAVKELRETPLKPRHRFVEFFDIRDAARALYELNGKDIFGKRVVIEFSRPGGQQARTSYCSRKGSASHQPTPLPPRLLRTALSSSDVVPSTTSSPSGGAPRSIPPTAPVRGAQYYCATPAPHVEEAAADNKGNNARRGKSSRSAAGSSGGAVSSSSSSRHQSGRHKGWKTAGGGKSRTAAEARFHIKEAITAVDVDASSSSCRDTRTTVMIKNIPNKYSQKLLLNMLDNHCIHCNERIAAEEGGGSWEPASAYDFVYLPIDFNNKCNVGYGFVNLTSPEATWRLYKAFHLQPWEVFNSRKICQVTYARLQGLEALKEHFKNSKFACDTDEYMPVVFSPPRDGKTLTDPAPIGCRGGAVVLTAAGKRKMAALMEEMGAPFSDDRPMDGGGCSSPSTTASGTLQPGDHEVEELDEEIVRSCCCCSTTTGAGGDEYARDDDDNEGRDAGGGGVGDMTELTQALRHHHL